MNTLPLAPLPSETSDESNEFRRIGSEGFIDELAVARVIARGPYDRVGTQPAGMALPADYDDYAGWMLPVKSPFRKMGVGQGAATATHRQPEPPALRKDSEPGIEAPYHGGHRWWLFGMSGAMTCGLMALTLFGLAQRHAGAGLATAPAPAASELEMPVAADTKAPDFPPSITTVITEQ